ncbi:MAG: M67 family metallopeptidase [Thermoleophilia bacterium]|nr:M67 family metallopeptidase [Thermoleophilia bacterium]
MIPAALRRELEAHAREALPGEACGLVLVRDGRAERYERGRNASDSPYRFNLDVDPELWFLEDEGWQLAVFHSHPGSEPRPSRTDVENVGLWEGRLYLIMRADTGELRAWRIAGGSFVEELLREA